MHFCAALLQKLPEWHFSVAECIFTFIANAVLMAINRKIMTFRDCIANAVLIAINRRGDCIAISTQNQLEYLFAINRKLCLFGIAFFFEVL